MELENGRVIRLLQVNVISHASSRRDTACYETNRPNLKELFIRCALIPVMGFLILFRSTGVSLFISLFWSFPNHFPLLGFP